MCCRVPERVSSSLSRPSAFVFNRLAELDLERLLRAEAHHVDVDDVARLEAADDALQRAHLIDRLAVGRDDDVADLDAGASSPGCRRRAEPADLGAADLSSSPRPARRPASTSLIDTPMTARRTLPYLTMSSITCLASVIGIAKP